MKVLVIGASGTIGQAVVRELKSDTDLITAGLNSGDHKVDMADTHSIAKLYQQTGPLDAIVCVAARGVIFKAMQDVQIEDYVASMQQKLLGQINLVLEGVNALNDRGSITLTTGIMNRDFVENGTAAAMVNSAVEGFAQAAALDLPRGIRINVVSPALLEESAEAYAKACPGFESVSSVKVGRAYRRSVYGIQTGMIFQVE